MFGLISLLSPYTNRIAGVSTIRVSGWANLIQPAYAGGLTVPLSSRHGKGRKESGNVNTKEQGGFARKEYQ